MPTLTIAALLVATAAYHPGDHVHTPGASTLGAPSPIPPFTIVAYPDTQYYSETAAWTYHFTAQTQWTKDWHAPFNIAFATHLGDIVDNGANGGNLVEWQRADGAIDILDTVLPNGAFPYGVCLGNHDFNVVSDKNSGSSVYDQFFGPARYAGRPWYQGYSPDRQNHAQLFTAGGRTYLHLTLEWRPDVATFQWAQTVLDAYPGMPTICSTHEHVNDANTSGTGAGRSAAGQTTWISLIRSNPQIFLFLNGHFASGVPNHNGEHAIVGINDAGREVLEMLSDYQAWTEGGLGYMRLIRLDERNGMVSVRSFSPSQARYQTDWNSQFRYAMDFSNRFDGQPSRFQTNTYRDGTNGFAGSSDVELNSATPAVANGTGGVMTVSNSDGTPAGPTHSLLKFENFIGSGAGQIAADRDIVLAKLRITITDSGSGLTLHDMLVPWTEASTWNALGAGVQADGIDAVASPVSVAGAANAGNLLPIQAIELDVTSSVRGWMNGAPNYGWAMLPFATTNGVDFQSSENGGFIGRPQLVVTSTTGPVAVATFQQGVNIYLGTHDTELRQSSPTTISGNTATMFIDSSDPNGTDQDRSGLLRFEGLFGGAPGQIPEGSLVTSAMLVLTSTQEGSGFTLHRVLVPWSESSTWNSMVGGVTTADVEAHRWAEWTAGTDADVAAVRTGPIYIDVTDSVQAWERGEANWGWAIQPRAAGANGLELVSSEGTTASSRPKLIVRYVAPATCAADVNGDGSVDGDDVIAFFQAWDAGQPGGDFNADGSVDGDDVIGYFVRWDLGC
ncbi:MAG: DNRLRE domain-containing protein [Phycisphaerales bacterium]